MAAMASMPRISNISVARQTKRPTSSRNSEKEAIWLPMLQSASKGKDITEKQLIVLGGSPTAQREFLEQLQSTEDTNRQRFNQPRKQRAIPVSNKYALGYTYHDVLDADQEDVLARLNVYMLSNSSAAFAALLTPLFSNKTVKDTLITILLDWSEPLKWAKQLRQWIRLLRKVIVKLDDETKLEMEENMNAWKEKRIGPDAHTQTAEQKTGIVPLVPLGPGEWDEGLGVPLCVVCSRSEKIEKLERESLWQEDHFDFLLQWLRTVLLKHGASLCFTATYDANEVRALIQSSLSIQSLLKRDVAKHNVIDRDKILVPPNWDSWGKIRILREAFDPENISDRWSLEIQPDPEHSIDFSQSESDHSSAVAIYEATLPPGLDALDQSSTTRTDVTVTAPSLQEFLQLQQTVVEQLRVEDERDGRTTGYSTGSVTIDTGADPSQGKLGSGGRVAEHVGTYQINVNGIDVDAEEATRKLREREQERAIGGSKRDTSGISTPTKPKVTETADGKPSTEQMSAFFANLMKKPQAGQRSGTASGLASPRRESPAPDSNRRLAGD